jgi:hypothetical protein
MTTVKPASAAAWQSRSVARRGSPPSSATGAAHGRLPAAAHIAEGKGGIRGFVLGRDGRASMQIGPLVAEDAATAIALLRAALAGITGPVCIDLGNAHQAVIEAVTRASFGPQFPFIRMIHGRSQAFDDPQRVVAIAGPELG